MPNLDNIIIISNYFNVTTDYLLKGVEQIEPPEKSGAVIGSQVLYVSSTALIAIGLLCGFTNWRENQTALDTMGAMIIQAVGIVAYFIARIVSHEKSPIYVNFLNVVLVLFMPLSMITGSISMLLFNSGRIGLVAPYPMDILHSVFFAVVYLIVCLLVFASVRKRTK